jgi:hypothetical protein
MSKIPDILRRQLTVIKRVGDPGDRRLALAYEAALPAFIAQVEAEAQGMLEPIAVDFATSKEVVTGAQS